jgi:WhiB family redox-sensing transcriptional regulator
MGRKSNLDLVLMSGEWAWQAACRDIEYPDIFFADAWQKKESRAAKLICSACPVSNECLEHSQIGAIQHGIFGGLGGGPRAALRRLAREGAL